MNSVFKSKHTEFHFIVLSARVSTLSSHLGFLQKREILSFSGSEKKRDHCYTDTTATGKSNPRSQVAVLPSSVDHFGNCSVR